MKTTRYLLDERRGAPLSAVNARHGQMRIRDILRMSDGKFHDFMREFADFFVPRCDVDCTAFFAGANTWLERHRSGAYALDEFAANDIIRHLDLWYCDLQPPRSAGARLYQKGEARQHGRAS